MRKTLYLWAITTVVAHIAFSQTPTRISPGQIGPIIPSAATLVIPSVSGQYAGSPWFGITGNITVTAVSGAYPTEQGTLTALNSPLTFTSGATIAHSCTTQPGATYAWYFDGTQLWVIGPGCTTQPTGLIINVPTSTTAFRIGGVTTNPYSVVPILSVVGGPSVFGSSANCFGLQTLVSDTSCYPTPGRVVTVSGLDNASLVDGYGIGIDTHPSLTATANNQTLVGLWVDPQIYNSGSSGFNCGVYSGCRTAGIVNIQSLEQLSPVMLASDFVGLQNGSLAASISNSNYWVVAIGNVDGVSPETWDVGSSSGSGLVGLEMFPTFKNTASGSVTMSAEYGADIRVTSHSTVSNTLTTQVGLHIQNSSVDGNTTVTNQYGLLIEALSTGGTLNYGIYNKSELYQTGAAVFTGTFLGPSLLSLGCATTSCAALAQTGESLQVQAGDGSTNVQITALKFVAYNGSSGNLTTYGILTPANSGTRFLCVSTAGLVTSSASACSGT